MANKLDEIIGKRTLKEMLELEEPDKDKVLDVVVPDIKEEKGLERIAEKGYKPKSIDVLKETGKDIARYSKATAGFIGEYVLGPQLFTGLFPYISSYLFSKRENTISNKYRKTVGKTLENTPADNQLTFKSFSWIVSLSFGAVASLYATGYLYGYEAVYNKNYWLLSIPVVTNVASFLYERIQANRLKLASKNKSLEGVVEKDGK